MKGRNVPPRKFPGTSERTLTRHLTWVSKWGRHKVRGKEALRSSVEFAP